jgi:hypothetical protein
VKLLDERMEAIGLAYARILDDCVILAPTRWKFRAAIRLVNESLAELKVEQQPDKTLIGRVSRSFDFLGYLFAPAGLEVAPRALERCVERVSRLYEQGVTWSASGHTFGAGSAGPGAASGRVRANLVASAMNRMGR